MLKHKHRFHPITSENFEKIAMNHKNLLQAQVSGKYISILNDNFCYRIANIFGILLII